MHACDVNATVRYGAYAQAHCQMKQDAGDAQAIDGALVAGDAQAAGVLWIDNVVAELVCDTLDGPLPPVEQMLERIKPAHEQLQMLVEPHFLGQPVFLALRERRQTVGYPVSLEVEMEKIPDSA